MNNSHLIFLTRSDHVLGLTAHILAGILALVLLTGAASAGNSRATHSETASSMVAGR